VGSISVGLLFAIYGKNVREDLTAKEKELAKKFSADFKEWARKNLGEGKTDDR